jgi:hypothetical protein
LWLKNGAGGVHEQLWQKSLWKETGNTHVEIPMWGQPPPAVHRAKLEIRSAPSAGHAPDALTIPKMWVKMNQHFPSNPDIVGFNRGPVAQLGARFHGMEEVVGSIPTRSTKP